MQIRGISFCMSLTLISGGISFCIPSMLMIYILCRLIVYELECK